MPVTEEFGCEFQGLVMGYGTPYEIISYEGLGTAPIIQANTPKLLGEGEFPGIDRYGPRDVVLSGEIWASTKTQMRTLLGNLLFAWFRTSVLLNYPFVFHFFDWPQDYVYGRSQGVEYTMVRRVEASLVLPFICKLHCTDPRIFDLATGTEVVI